MGAEAISLKRRYSFEEYLKLEKQEGIRYEYYSGEVYTMAGGSMNHSDVSDNINGVLKSAFAEKECRSFQENLKIELGKGKSYVYPDVVLTCNNADVEDGYIIRNPLLIVEVLSPSTESYDRNVKWHQYRRMSSLKYFLFVSQERPFVEMYSRSQPNALYVYQAFDDMEDVIQFPELDFSLSLQQIYNKIRFKELPPLTSSGIFTE